MISPKSLFALLVMVCMASARAAPFTEYKVLGANDLGMHCVDDDFSTMTILPPFNVVQGQIIGIDRNGKPKLLTPGNQVELTYSATADPAGSINSSWLDNQGNPKTNFWDYQGAYGLNLPDGQGIFGLTLPKDAGNDLAKRSFGWEAPGKIFKAAGIPILPIDDEGKKNFYPMLQLEARNARNHALLPGGKTRVVLPVSDETTCNNCHATGAVAADSAGVAWSTHANPSVAYRENVLKLHDLRNGTSLESSKPVLCAACHYSAALDLAGTGPSEEQKRHSTMSAAMHDYHADKMVLNGGKLPDEPVPVGGGVPPSGEQSCYQCHPGANTKCLRGAMTQNVTCQNCHGGMAATGGHDPLLAGGSLDGANDGGKRRPWMDLPRCQSCHTGDEVNHLATTPATSADGLRQVLAFQPDDPAASPRLASNRRFAENDKTLFRFSKGHGGILCEGCHNSTHAIWPGDAEHPNDDVTAVQAQGHAGTLIECKACHKKNLRLSMDGPHGMHNVNDSQWIRGEHGDFYEKKPAECQACHGMDFRGSELGKVAVDRTFATGEFGTQRYRKGDKVSCYDCHDGPNFDD